MILVLRMRQPAPRSYRLREDFPAAAAGDRVQGDAAFTVATPDSVRGLGYISQPLKTVRALNGRWIPEASHPASPLQWLYSLPLDFA